MREHFHDYQKKDLHQPWYQAGHSETSLPLLLDPADHWALANKLSLLLFFPFLSTTLSSVSSTSILLRGTHCNFATVAPNLR